MKLRLVLICGVTLCLCNVAGAADRSTEVPGPMKIGTEVFETYASPHPYPGGRGDETLVWTDVLHVPGATYIAPHFARFELAEGDRVVIRSPDGTRSRSYTGLGKLELGRAPEGFWGMHIDGDTAIVELYSTSATGGFGYTIDKLARGYRPEELGVPQTEALCGSDDSEWAPCYATSEPEIYDQSRAVARLTINGTGGCTGWLIGCGGYVMTNEHCITSDSDAANTDFEFMSEGATCDTDCSDWDACPGTIAADSSTLIRDNAALDYSLVLLPDDVTGDYGYMRLRPEGGAVVDERMYIPQHPQHWGKKIAVESTASADESGFAEVYSLDEPPCSGGPGDVGYYADTQAGSSGSPVLGYSDHKVIALHHCANCPNRGVPMDAIIADLGDELPDCAVCDDPAIPTGTDASVTGDNEVTISWTNGDPPATTFNVYRSFDGCPQTAPELVAEGLTDTTFVDTGVSGGTTYSYTVTGVDATGGCESDPSSCSQVDATGVCTRAPTFDGIQEVVNPFQSTCQLDLVWNAATPHCSATVVYNVYRSTDPELEPDPSNLVASCLDATSLTDLVNLSSGVEYFYIVRAEDTSGNGTGPCAGGNEDDNIERLSSKVFGPLTDGTFAAGAEAGDPDLLLGGIWSISTDQAHTGAASYFSGHENDQCDALEIPATLLTPGEVSTLSFYSAWDIESRWDGGVLEMAVDGGPWTPLDIEPGYPGTFRSSSDACGYDADQPSFTGTGSAADLTFGQEYTVDLSAHNGSEVALRWRFSTDYSVTDIGWFVDDITLTHAATPSACTTVPGCDPTFDGLKTLEETTGAMQGMHLTWDPATPCAGLDLHYRVFHGADAASVDWSTPITTTEATEIDLYGMAPGTEHCFGVRAFEGPALSHDENTEVLCLTGTGTALAGDTDVDDDLDTADMAQLVAVLYGAPDMGSGMVAADVNSSGEVDAADAATEIGYLHDDM